MELIIGLCALLAVLLFGIGAWLFGKANLPAALTSAGGMLFTIAWVLHESIVG